MLAHPTARASTLDAGFTLLELLVVVMIMGLIATIAIPRIPSLDKERLQSSAIKLVADLRLLKARATQLQQITTILIEDHAYVLLPQERRQVLQANATLGMALPLPSLLGITKKKIEFFPDGSSTGGTVVLKQGSTSIGITVRWTDGLAQVHG